MRYVQILGRDTGVHTDRFLDTSTGKIWRYIDGSSEADGECGWQIVRQSIPYRSHSVDIRPQKKE